MTNNYHSPLGYGGALTSALMEAPLGQLDSGLTSAAAAITAETARATTAEAALLTTVGATPGAAVSLTGSAASGQKVVPLASVTSGFVAGQTCWIAKKDGSLSEPCAINTISAGVSVTLYGNLTNSYASGDVFSATPPEVAGARADAALGRSAATLGARIHLIDPGTIIADVVADSATDNYAVLQAAANALPSNGGTVMVRNIGDGHVVGVSQGVNFPSCGVLLVGLGSPGTVIRALAGFTGTSVLTFMRAANTANGNSGITIRDLDIDCNGQACHGVTVRKGYNAVTCTNSYVYGVADAYSAWRFIPPGDQWVTATVYAAGAYTRNAGNWYSTVAGGTSGATPPTHTTGTVSDGGVSWVYGGNCVSQGLVLTNIMGIHKNDTATAPTILLDTCQESQAINCKAWGGPTIAATAPGWQIIDARGFQMRGGAASNSAVEGILVTGSTHTSIGIKLDAVTFENVALAVRATGTASAGVSRLAIRDPRFEGTVTDGVALSYVAVADIEVDAKTVVLDANTSQTHVWTIDRSKVTDNGTFNSIHEWKNGINSGVYVGPAVETPKVLTDAIAKSTAATGVLFQSNSRRAVQQVAYAASFTPDAGAYSQFEVGSLTGNITINAPTNPAGGQEITFNFRQDGTGGRTITFNAIFHASWTPNTGASMFDSISFVYDSLRSAWIQSAASVGMS